MNENMSYQNKLDERHEAPFYFKHFYFTELLPKEQSSMLSYLIAIENYSRVRLKDDPTYFECNVSGFVNRNLRGWSVSEITSAINNLVNNGYITKRIVNKNKTFIALNHNQLDKLYAQWQEMQKNDNELTITITK